MIGTAERLARPFDRQGGDAVEDVEDPAVFLGSDPVGRRRRRGR